MWKRDRKDFKEEDAIAHDARKFLEDLAKNGDMQAMKTLCLHGINRDEHMNRLHEIMETTDDPEIKRKAADIITQLYGTKRPAGGWSNTSLRPTNAKSQ